MTVYFADRIVPYLEDDILGIDSTLFEDILHILGIGIFIMDIAVGDMRPTQLDDDSESNKIVTICFQGETPLNSFDVVSTGKSTRPIPLYFIDDSMDDFQLILVD
jgi:hypothetical protein